MTLHLTSCRREGVSETEVRDLIKRCEEYEIDGVNEHLTVHETQILIDALRAFA